MIPGALTEAEIERLDSSEIQILYSFPGIKHNFKRCSRKTIDFNLLNLDWSVLTLQGFIIFRSTMPVAIGCGNSWSS